MARVTPRVPSAPAASTTEEEEAVTTQSVERPLRAPDQDNIFTLVKCKKARKKEERMKKKACLKEMVEPLRSAPVQGTTPRPRCPAVEVPNAAASVELPRLAPDSASVDNRLHHVDQDEDEDQDQDQDSDPIGTYAEWRIAAFGETFSSCYQAVRWMESTRKLNFSVRVSHVGEYYVRAKSLKTACDLSAFACDSEEGIVLEKCEKEVRGVILGFPVHLPLDPITDHPSVRSAERCLANVGRGRRLPTRSVRVTWRGTLPTSLDLGCWGRFACRRFVPEPLRCFRCQAYGHHQRSCPRTDDLCGACSGTHSTRECLLRRRDGGNTSAPSPLCINCGARHYAWYRRCPARLRRIQGALPPPRDTRRHQVAAPTGPTHQAAHQTRPQFPTVLPEDGRNINRSQRSGRRRRHRRNRRRAPAVSALRPSATPTGEEEASTQTPQVMQQEAVRAREAAPVAENTSTPPADGKKQEVKTTEEAAVQTERRLVYSLMEMLAFLGRFELLVAQEAEAQHNRIPHESVLHFARRHLKTGEYLPHMLSMARPLEDPPSERVHFNEPKWVDYPDEDTEEEEEEGDDGEKVKTPECPPSTVYSPAQTRSKTKCTQ